MKRQINICKIAVFFTLLLSVTIVTQAFALNMIADDDITYWVKDTLRNDARVDASEITVKTKKGIVTLTGSVETLAAKKYANLEAKKINGVLGVINRIEIKPTWRSDADIRNAVRRRILNSAVIESQGIAVTSDNGKVTLSGTVDTYSEEKEAELLAGEVRGVKEVENIIKTKWKTKRSDQEIKNDAVAALERDVYLSGLPITIAVENAVVTLTGSVGNAYEKDRAGSDARWISNVKDVRNKLKVEWWEKRGVREKAVLPSDSALKKAVRAELDQDNRLDASDITIKATSGYLILNGSVFSHYQKRIAEKDARNVAGVGWVTNNLFARVDRREDWVIQEDIAFNLETDSTLEGFDIETTVNNGVVALSGNVHTWYEKFHAADIASRVKGVKNVINDISAQMTSLKKNAELIRTIKKRIKWNWTTFAVRNKINVNVYNGVATLMGDVNSWSERREAGRVALLTEGIRKVDNLLTVKGYNYPWDEWYIKGPYYHDHYYEEFDYYPYGAY